MGKERLLDKVYTEFENTYAGKSEEEMQMIISNLEKEIAAKENLVGTLTEEKSEKMQKDIDSKKRKLENLKGYSANKNQIEGIRKYRDSLILKLEQETATRNESLKLYEAAQKSYYELSKKLENEKYTKQLDQYEYNDLQGEKEKYKKEIQIQSERYMDAKNRVLDLKGKIGKCNLAWKTLFVNKGWDLIHARALENNTRFKRKIDPEKDTPLSKKKREEVKPILKETKDKLSQTIKEMYKKEDDAELDKKVERVQPIVGPGNTQVEKAVGDTELDNEEPKALIERKEGFFKRLWKKIKDKMTRKEKANKDEEEPKITDTKPIEEKSETVNAEKDSFIEGLRRHVDKEYSENVKRAIDEQYKETHKIQPKKEETEQEMGE